MWITKNQNRRHQAIELYTLYLVILQILDAVFTAEGITRWGLCVEGNPIIVLLVENLGLFLGLLVIKIYAVGVLILLRFYLYKSNQSLGNIHIAYFLPCIIYTFIVITWFLVLFIFQSPPLDFM